MKLEYVYERFEVSSPYSENRSFKMELQKGKCFYCNKTRVISVLPKTLLKKILSRLFTQEILNNHELKNCASLLKVCPACLHKLILLKEANKMIMSHATTISESDICLLCGSEYYCIKILNSCQHFKKISEDYLPFTIPKDIIICSGCIFYLDSRNTVKTILCSIHPQLKDGLMPKVKPKEIHTKTIVTNTLKMNKRMFCESSDSNDLSMDSSPLTGLKALKYDELFKKPRSIYCDSKFMNQILYIKIDTRDSLSSINLNQDKNKSDQHINIINSGEHKLSNTKLNINLQRIQDDISINKCVIIKRNTNEHNTNAALSRKKNQFFKIKLKENEKSHRTHKRADGMKNVPHIIEPDFDRKLVINIFRYDVETFQSTNHIESIHSSNTEEIDTRKISDSESSESLFMAIDEQTTSDSENSKNNSTVETIEEHEKGQLISIDTNVFEDTDSNKTINLDEIVKTLYQNDPSKADCIKKKFTDASSKSKEENFVFEIDDQCIEEVHKRHNFKIKIEFHEDENKTHTTQDSQENKNISQKYKSCSGNNGKRIGDSNDELTHQIHQNQPDTIEISEENENISENQIKSRSENNENEGDDSKEEYTVQIEDIDIVYKDENQLHRIESSDNETNIEWGSRYKKENEDDDQTEDMDSEIIEIDNEMRYASSEASSGNNKKEKDYSNNELTGQTKDLDTVDKDEDQNNTIESSEDNVISETKTVLNSENKGKNDGDEKKEMEVNGIDNQLKNDSLKDVSNTNEENKDISNGKVRQDFRNISDLENGTSNNEDFGVNNNKQISQCRKRELDDSNGDVSCSDKKKKRVTFSDTVRESSV